MKNDYQSEEISRRAHGTMPFVPVIGYRLPDESECGPRAVDVLKGSIGLTVGAGALLLVALVTLKSFEHKWDGRKEQMLIIAVTGFFPSLAAFAGFRSAWFYFGGYATLRKKWRNTFSMGWRPWKWRWDR